MAGLGQGGASRGSAGLGMAVNPHPFPHLISDDMFDRALLHDVLEELTDSITYRKHRWQRFYRKRFWHKFNNEHERKFSGDLRFWGKRTRELFDHLATPDFCTLVADTFAMPELTMDPIGGGYHAIPPGGYLDIHTDFNRAPDGRYRRLNLMTYLNDDWQDEGGWLELGENDVRVAPRIRANRHL